MPGCRRKALRYRLLCSVCRSSLGLVDALCPIDLQLWNAEFCPRPTTGGQVAAGHGIDAGGEAGNGASPGQEERLAQISAMKKKELTAELARLGLETIKKEKDADTRQRLVDHLNASNGPSSEGAGGEADNGDQAEDWGQAADEGQAEDGDRSHGRPVPFDGSPLTRDGEVGPPF